MFPLKRTMNPLGQTPSLKLDLPYKTGLRLWVDFSDLATLFQDAARTIPVTADGDVIGGVADKSGNGFHGSQSLTADKPLYKANFKNGLSVARFDGAGDRFVHSLVQTTLVYTMFAVSRSSAAGGTRMLAFNGDGAANGYGFFPYLSKRQILYGGKVFLEDAAQTTNYELWTGRRDTSTTLAVNGVNQALTNSSVIPNTPTTNTYIGGTSAANGFLGDICELLIYDNAVSAPNVALIEAYLNSKWAIY